MDGKLADELLHVAQLDSQARRVPHSFLSAAGDAGAATEALRRQVRPFAAREAGAVANDIAGSAKSGDRRRVAPVPSGASPVSSGRPRLSRRVRWSVPASLSPLSRFSSCSRGALDPSCGGTLLPPSSADSVAREDTRGSAKAGRGRAEGPRPQLLLGGGAGGGAGQLAHRVWLEPGGVVEFLSAIDDPSRLSCRDACRLGLAGGWWWSDVPRAVSSGRQRTIPAAVSSWFESLKDAGAAAAESLASAGSLESGGASRSRSWSQSTGSDDVCISDRGDEGGGNDTGDGHGGGDSGEKQAAGATLPGAPSHLGDDAAPSDAAPSDAAPSDAAPSSSFSATAAAAAEKGVEPEERCATHKEEAAPAAVREKQDATAQTTGGVLGAIAASWGWVVGSSGVAAPTDPPGTIEPTTPPAEGCIWPGASLASWRVGFRAPGSLWSGVLPGSALGPPGAAGRSAGDGSRRVAEAAAAAAPVGKGDIAVVVSDFALRTTVLRLRRSPAAGSACGHITADDWSALLRCPAEWPPRLSESLRSPGQEADPVLELAAKAMAAAGQPEDVAPVEGALQAGEAIGSPGARRAHGWIATLSADLAVVDASGLGLVVSPPCGASEAQASEVALRTARDAIAAASAEVEAEQPTAGVDWVSHCAPRTAMGEGRDLVSVATCFHELRRTTTLARVGLAPGEWEGTRTWLSMRNQLVRSSPCASLRQQVALFTRCGVGGHEGCVGLVQPEGPNAARSGPAPGQDVLAGHDRVCLKASGAASTSGEGAAGGSGECRGTGKRAGRRRAAAWDQFVRGPTGLLQALVPMERQVSLATVVRDQGVESSGLGSQTSPEVVPTRLRLLGGIPPSTVGQASASEASAWRSSQPLERAFVFVASSQRDESGGLGRWGGPVAVAGEGAKPHVGVLSQRVIALDEAAPPSGDGAGLGRRGTRSRPPRSVVSSVLDVVDAVEALRTVALQTASGQALSVPFSPAAGALASQRDILRQACRRALCTPPPRGVMVMSPSVVVRNYLPFAVEVAPLAAALVPDERLTVSLGPHGSASASAALHAMPRDAGDGSGAAALLRYVGMASGARANRGVVVVRAAPSPAVAGEPSPADPGALWTHPISLDTAAARLAASAPVVLPLPVGTRGALGSGRAWMPVSVQLSLSPALGTLEASFRGESCGEAAAMLPHRNAAGDEGPSVLLANCCAHASVLVRQPGVASRPPSAAAVGTVGTRWWSSNDLLTDEERLAGARAAASLVSQSGSVGATPTAPGQAEVRATADWRAQCSLAVVAAPGASVAVAFASPPWESLVATRSAVPPSLEVCIARPRAAAALEACPGAMLACPASALDKSDWMRVPLVPTPAASGGGRARLVHLAWNGGAVGPEPPSDPSGPPDAAASDGSRPAPQEPPAFSIRVEQRGRSVAIVVEPEFAAGAAPRAAAASAGTGSETAEGGSDPLEDDEDPSGRNRDACATRGDLQGARAQPGPGNAGTALAGLQASPALPALHEGDAEGWALGAATAWLAQLQVDSIEVTVAESTGVEAAVVFADGVLLQAGAGAASDRRGARACVNRLQVDVFAPSASRASALHQRPPRHAAMLLARAHGAGLDRPHIAASALIARSSDRHVVYLPELRVRTQDTSLEVTSETVNPFARALVACARAAWRAMDSARQPTVQLLHSRCDEPSDGALVRRASYAEASATGVRRGDRLEASVGLSGWSNSDPWPEGGRLADRTQGRPQRSCSHGQNAVLWWKADGPVATGVGQPSLGESLRAAPACGGAAASARPQRASPTRRRRALSRSSQADTDPARRSLEWIIDNLDVGEVGVRLTLHYDQALNECIQGVLQQQTPTRSASRGASFASDMLRAMATMWASVSDVRIVLSPVQRSVSGATGQEVAAMLLASASASARGQLLRLAASADMVGAPAKIVGDIERGASRALATLRGRDVGAEGDQDARSASNRAYLSGLVMPWDAVEAPAPAQPDSEPEASIAASPKGSWAGTAVEAAVRAGRASVHLTGSVLGSAGRGTRAIAATVSNGLLAVVGDRPNYDGPGRGDRSGRLDAPELGLVSGATSAVSHLRQGLESGVSGVFRDTVEAWSAGGATGAAAGLVRGAAGLVIRPVAGAVAAAGAAAQGLGDGFSSLPHLLQQGAGGSLEGPQLALAAVEELLAASLAEGLAARPLRLASAMDDLSRAGASADHAALFPAEAQEPLPGGQIHAEQSLAEVRTALVTSICDTASGQPESSEGLGKTARLAKAAAWRAGRGAVREAGGAALHAPGSLAGPEYALREEADASSWAAGLLAAVSARRLSETLELATAASAAFASSMALPLGSPPRRHYDTARPLPRRAQRLPWGPARVLLGRSLWADAGVMCMSTMQTRQGVPLASPRDRRLGWATPKSPCPEPQLHLQPEEQYLGHAAIPMHWLASRREPDPSFAPASSPASAATAPAPAVGEGGAPPRLSVVAQVQAALQRLCGTDHSGRWSTAGLPGGSAGRTFGPATPNSKGTAQRASGTSSRERGQVGTAASRASGASGPEPPQLAVALATTQRVVLFQLEAGPANGPRRATPDGVEGNAWAQWRASYLWHCPVGPSTHAGLESRPASASSAAVFAEADALLTRVALDSAKRRGAGGAVPASAAQEGPGRIAGLSRGLINPGAKEAVAAVVDLACRRLDDAAPRHGAESLPASAWGLAAGFAGFAITEAAVWAAFPEVLAAAVEMVRSCAALEAWHRLQAGDSVGAAACQAVVAMQAGPLIARVGDSPDPGAEQSAPDFPGPARECDAATVLAVVCLVRRGRPKPGGVAADAATVDWLASGLSSAVAGITATAPPVETARRLAFADAALRREWPSALLAEETPEAWAIALLLARPVGGCGIGLAWCRALAGTASASLSAGPGEGESQFRVVEAVGAGLLTALAAAGGWAP